MNHEPNTPQQEIALLQVQLAQARAELQEFTYSVSHDLRASLRHVTAYVQIIKEDLGQHPDPAIIASLKTVSVAAKHMGVLIDGLTELSKLGHAAVSNGCVDTGQLLQDLQGTATSALAADVADRQIEWAVAQDFPPVCADAALVRQVWNKLLSNALKYTRGRPVARIEIGWALADNGFCVFHIKDNGVGFNPRFKEKLFRVFQRLHSATEFEGTGLGLALTRKIVERHGGTVWAEGDVDAGCTIRFTLPLFEAGSSGAA
ncbi:MAG: hypothetical protein RIS34_1426 [Pseudomonadota bacterium]|jgi:light-regulated signal transduction histidine kinase (bacteriophytochrome)